MVIDIKDLRTDWKTAVDEMDTILKKADSEKRDMTEAEEKRLSELMQKSDDLKGQIAKAEAEAERRNKVASMVHETRQIQKSIEFPNINTGAEDDKEFKSLGEFLHAVVGNRSDPRLKNLYEAREQSMGTGVKGGFMVPPQFRATLMELPVQQAVFRSRCASIPTEGDAAVTVPTMDQSPGKGRLSGVDVNWIAEGGNKPETDMYLQEITLTPKEIAAHAVLTDKLIRNWPACETIITSKIRSAMINAVEIAILSGNGVGKPKGFLGSGASISVTRTGTTSIVYADIVNMYNQFYDEMGEGVWFANKTILPKLMTMKDDSSGLIWYPGGRANAKDGVPDTLMGLPIVWNYRQPTLGAEGDLILADMSHYAICEGSGPYVAASSHVYFLNNKTVVKVFNNLDGMPWLSTTIPMSDTASTVVTSPFVYMST